MTANVGPSLHEKPGFEMVVAVVILANTVSAIYMLFGDESLWLERFETSCLVFFVGELLLRIKHHGLAFFRSPWSWLDTSIIVLSLLPVLGLGVSVLRIGRFARLIHLGRHMAGLRAFRLLALAHWRLTQGPGINLTIEGAQH